MTGPVTRKIAIAKQIEELEREAGMRAGFYPRQVQSGKMRQSSVDEATERLAGAIATLKFNQQHEHLFRAWLAERKGDGLRFRIRDGKFCWASPLAPDDWMPITADEANIVLARFDAPAKAEPADA